MPELKLAENAHTNSHNISVTQQHSPLWTWASCGIICDVNAHLCDYHVIIEAKMNGSMEKQESGIRNPESATGGRTQKMRQ